MNYVKRLRRSSNSNWCKAVFVSIVMGISMTILITTTTSCSSYFNPAEQLVEQKVPSFDEYNNQTSGLIGVTSDKQLFIVTQHLVDRYNHLIDLYKSDKNVGIEIDITKNFGIADYKEDSKYLTMTPLAMTYFRRLIVYDSKIKQVK